MSVCTQDIAITIFTGESKGDIQYYDGRSAAQVHHFGICNCVED